MIQSLAEIVGLPHESQLPENDMEMREKWSQMLEKGIVDIIDAGVILTLRDWAAWTMTERAMYLSVKGELDKIEEQAFFAGSGYDSLEQALEAVKVELGGNNGGCDA